MRRYGAMQNLSDELLVETYHKARELNLSDDFLNLVLKEIELRAMYDKKIDL